MCGILGFYGDYGESALRSGLRKISHRGPDDTGIYFSGEKKIGLGHVRLAIQDLSELGHQPMISQDGSAIIIFNGEIYNQKKIRHKLIKEGFVFKGTSDTEVLLNLYLSKGFDLVYELNGIFAFAIWDFRKKLLFLLGLDGLQTSEVLYQFNL